MRKTNFYFIAAAMAVLTFASCQKDDGVVEKRITFEDVTLNNNGYQNNFPNGLLLSDVRFSNNYSNESGFVYWYGFAVSSNTDMLTADYSNQFSVYGTGGAGGSKQFAVAYQDNFNGVDSTYLQLSPGKELRFKSLEINNSTYTALTIKNGNDFAKKFESGPGEEGDWFKVVITGYDANGLKTRDIDFYLADYRNNATIFCDDWQTVNLLPLGSVNRITFRFESSDTGSFGINTPTYACIDNIVYLVK